MEGVSLIYRQKLHNTSICKCKYPKCKVVQGDPDRGNIPCLMHDTRLYKIDVKMTNNEHGTKKI